MQLLAVLAKPAGLVLPARSRRSQQSPERLLSARHTQVAELVNDDVLKDLGRRRRQAPREPKVRLTADARQSCGSCSSASGSNGAGSIGYERLTLVVLRCLLYTRASNSVAERNVVACDQAVDHARLYLGVDRAKGHQALAQTHQLLCAESLQCVGLGGDRRPRSISASLGRSRERRVARTGPVGLCGASGRGRGTRAGVFLPVAREERVRAALFTS
jgi:hypothetical protein